MSANTAFIVGAGASFEVGLPTGAQLVKKICESLKSRDISINGSIWADQEIIDATVKLSRIGQLDTNSYIKECSAACRKIYTALPGALSIDNFLNSHQGDRTIELCGKLAICKAILVAENESVMCKHMRDRSYVDDNLKSFLHQLNNTWYLKLAQFISCNTTKDTIINKLRSTAFIIFNYDRCVEYFLINFLKIYYNFSEEEALDIVNSMEIYHPYGTIGYLPGQDVKNTVGFGATPSADMLCQTILSIKTFSENHPSKLVNINEIRNCFQSAKRLLFLGFSFQRPNMNLLFPTGKEKINAEACVGTAFGISESNKKEITTFIYNRMNRTTKTIHLQDIECRRVFDEYSKLLNFW